MKEMKKVLLAAVLLIAMLPVSLMAAGGKESGDADAGVIMKETVTLNVYSQLANYSGEQIGWFAQVLKEKFNVKLNIINDEEGVFTTRMASGDLGDIVIFGNDTDEYQQAWQAGLLWDWNDENLLEDYGPYIADYMQKPLEKNASISGGTVYGFGHNVASSAEDHEPFFYHPDLRWDLYKKLGYPEINTLEDYIDVLEDMVALQPESDTGGKTYAVSLFPDWDGDMVMFVKSTAALYGWDEFGFGLYNADTDEYQDLFAKDSMYLRCLRFYNELHQRGLLDPDSMTQNYDMHSEKFQKGAALFVIFDWMGSGVYNSDAHLAAGKAMAPRPANDAKTISYGLNVYGQNRVWTIGAKTQYPELCMTIINWLSTPEGTLTNFYGPKGVAWDYNDEGYAYLTDLGMKTVTDPATEMTGGYTGTKRDGSNQMNNTTWSAGASNPEGNNEIFDYHGWKTYKAGAVEPIIQDWRDYTGFDSFESYIESKGFTVAPGTAFSMSTRSDELQTTWNQVAEAIKTHTWQAIYADSDAEFNRLVKEMEEKAKAYGYDECVAWTEKEAEKRAKFAKAAKGESSSADVLASAAPSLEDESGAIPLGEKITGSSGNNLAKTLGPVTVNVKNDTSYTSNDPINGGGLKMVEYLGEKCLQVKQNFNKEIRVAFVPEKPVSAKGFSKIRFKVAGLDGGGGIYNCGILYTDAKDSGERTGSFYVSNVSSEKWTTVEVDLNKDEVWGKNFAADKMLYCIQFWTNRSKYIYIKDLEIE